MKRMMTLIIAIILAINLIPVSVSADESFKDVSTDDWFYDNVNTAVEYDLMVGVSETEFAPKQNVTLAMAVTLAARVYSNYICDYEIFRNRDAVWYEPYVDYAYKKGIINGEMDWEKPATRLEIAQIFAKSLPNEAWYELNIVEDGSIPDVPLNESVYKLYRAGIFAGSDEQGSFYPDSYITRAEIAAVVSRLYAGPLRIVSPSKNKINPEDFVMDLDGIQITYGETIESVKKKITDDIETMFSKSSGLVGYRIGKASILCRLNKQTNEEYVVAWTTTENGVGTDKIKVGESYKKIREIYYGCTPIHLDERDNPGSNNPANCSYNMYIDENGNCYSTNAYSPVLIKNYGKGNWTMVSIGVRDGVITDVSFGEVRALINVQ